MKRFVKSLTIGDKTILTGTDNVRISKADLDFIRSLEDFDLTMLVSEVNDHGWDYAAKMLPDMRQAINSRKGKQP